MCRAVILLILEVSVLACDERAERPVWSQYI